MQQIVPRSANGERPDHAGLLVVPDRAVELVLARIEVHGQPSGAVHDGLGLLLDPVALDLDCMGDLRGVGEGDDDLLRLGTERGLVEGELSGGIAGWAAAVVLGLGALVVGLAAAAVEPGATSAVPVAAVIRLVVPAPGGGESEGRDNDSDERDLIRPGVRGAEAPGSLGRPQ
jgi:hypothetical protein